MLSKTIPITPAAFAEAHRRVAAHVHHTPMLTSRLLSEATGFDVRLKAEVFQRTGSYKIRGPLNKFAELTPEERKRGVILLVGREPCTGCGARRLDLRHSRRGLHGVERNPFEGRGHEGLRC